MIKTYTEIYEGATITVWKRRGGGWQSEVVLPSGRKAGAAFEQPTKAKALSVAKKDVDACNTRIIGGLV